MCELNIYKIFETKYFNFYKITYYYHSQYIWICNDSSVVKCVSTDE